MSSKLRQWISSLFKYAKLAYNSSMQIINRVELDKFKRKHPQSRVPLNNWENIMSNTEYLDLNALRKTFAKKVDYTSSGYIIFDIGGNKFRLITVMDYSFRAVDIRVVWTHNEYSSPKNMKDLKDGKI